MIVTREDRSSEQIMRDFKRIVVRNALIEI